MTTKSWKNHPQKLLRTPQIHFFSSLPWLPKRPKQKNSCSKMWPIEQLYIELGFYAIYPTVRGGNSRHSKSKEWRASPRLHVILVTSIWYLEVKSSVQGYTFGVSTISKYSRLPNIRPVPRKSIQVEISWKTNKRTVR